MSAFSYSDIFAFIFFLLAISGYSWLTQYSPLSQSNISKNVQDERVAWMNAMIERENRMVDMLILTNLSHGNAFFASTAIVIAGAFATVLGSASNLGTDNQFNTVLENIPFSTPTEPYVFNAKLLFIMIIFLTAFFKFAWAFRLTHYASIMIGATPVKTEENIEMCKAHASRVANLSGLAGYHSNGGLHTYYYGIAACGWFFNPLIFMLATTLIIAILYRREYKSKGHAILSHKTK